MHSCGMTSIICPIRPVATFAAEPALWVMERLLKMTGPVGAAAHRGTAAEAGIVAGLLNPDMPIEPARLPQTLHS